MGLKSLFEWGITYKILAITIAVSAVVWSVINSYQEHQLQEMFLDKAYAELKMGASDDRRLFDQYTQTLLRSVKLIVGQNQFVDFVKNMPPAEQGEAVKMAHLAQLPSWMPRSSIMRTFYNARYALLFDENGVLRSSYHHSYEHTDSETVPEELLKPNSILRKLSHNQAYMTMVEGIPFLIASEKLKTDTGFVTLALVSPIDSDYLEEAVSGQNHKTIIALVDKDSNLVVASSHREGISVGANINELKNDYIMVKKSFFDYGASDLKLQLSSFASTVDVGETTDALLKENKFQRATLVVAMIVTFSLIMLFFVRRVISLGNKVNQLSLNLLNKELKDERKGDELAVLGNQFTLLATELTASRDQLRAEINSSNMLAKDLREKSHSLNLTNENLKGEIAVRKQSEKERDLLSLQLQQSQKMEAIGRITGGVAHDFNNILAAILGFSELAQQRFGSQEANNKLNEYLTNIIKAGERGRDLVASMLIFSRGETGEKKVVSLDVEIKNAVSMLRPTISSSIDIETTIPNREVHIKVDPIGLQQALTNLIVNARDSMESEKGLIKISIKHIAIKHSLCASCHDPIQGEYLELSVSDTGKGIASEIMPNVFEPFFSTKGVGQGSGMGLSVLHGFLHANGGHVLLDSKIDEGTSFRLLFPASNEEDANSDNSVIEKKSVEFLKYGQIMVVDDEVAITNYLHEFLESHGHKVITFNESGKALSHYRNNPFAFDLIVTDQAMPQLTGIELTDEIRKLNPNIPIIMCTGYSATTNEFSAKEHGVTEYLMKPVNTNILVTTIDKLLGDKNG